MHLAGTPGRGLILIVDDSIDHIQTMASVLQLGYDVLFATNGADALAIAASRPLDLILLDVLMPGMDGFAVCASLKHNPLTADIPVIFLTTLNDAADETYGLELGGSDFLTKPVNPAVLKARVRTQIGFKRYRDNLREMSVTDGLTGVANRRGFETVLDTEWRRCYRERLPLALIMLDIDQFKLYNDEYGHQAGDVCLIQVAAAMRRAAARAGDVVSRFGGEEFAILLPENSVTGAETVARKVLEEIITLQIEHNRSTVSQRLTVSMGVASMTANAQALPDMLVKAADRALYQAKKGGRNRFVASAPAPLPELAAA
jgi:diguanylate cyclase (GGDEF)-like protein